MLPLRNLRQRIRRNPGVVSRIAMLGIRRASPIYRLVWLRGRTLFQSRNNARTFSGLANRRKQQIVPCGKLINYAITCRNYSDLPSHVIVKLPALSPTMETGTIVSWDKSVGDEVEQGDVLAQVETDKATMDMESSKDGYLAKILVKEGTAEIALGQEVCIIVENKEDIVAFENYEVKPVEQKVSAAPEQPVQKQEAPPTPPVAPQQAPPTPAPVSQPAPTVISSTQQPSRLFVSPLARTVAKERGIDIQATNVQGSGMLGSIVAGDLSSVATPAVQQPSLVGDYEDIPHSQTRKTIARRLSEAKTSIPHYYEVYDINMSTVLQLRKELNALPDVKISVNDIVIKAVANAIRLYPVVNCEWRDDVIRRHNKVNVSVAVDTDKGLITPVVTNADAKGLKQISSDMQMLRNKALEGKLTPEEYQGGTFTISNLGMKGVKQFTAIINPPQACILAVGAIQKRPIYCEDCEHGFKMADMMTVTLSSDHRAVDGAQAADWLLQLKSLLENPNLLLL